MPVDPQVSQLISELNEQNVQLVAVSKTKPVSAIQALYDAGHKVFGENRVQELVQKYEQLPKDIQWHMIGHLQTNKVKYIAPFVSLIHGVDSAKLLKEVNKQAKKHNRVIPCLLQIHIAEESSKFGFEEGELIEYLETGEWQSYTNVQISGVMGMATFTYDEAQVRREFTSLHKIFNNIGRLYFKDLPHFKELSMGMSGDYLIAIEEGSTMVRIGSLIFGSR